MDISDTMFSELTDYSRFPATLPPFAPGLPAPVRFFRLPHDHRILEEHWRNNMVGGVSLPVVGHYPAPGRKPGRPAMVICPGGGYEWLSMEHEGTMVAAWLNTLGIDGFLLKSRLGGHGHPAPLQDVTAALRRVRAFAPGIGVDPDRIGVIGFSAGGHLAASASTLYESPQAAEPDARFAGISARPDFSILIYPVVTLLPGYSHGGSRRQLLGESASEEAIIGLSPERQVTASTPPAFLAHAQDDPAVPVENAILYYQALRRFDIPASMHLFPEGNHGFGIWPGPQPVRQWPQLAAAWLRANGFADPVS